MQEALKKREWPVTASQESSDVLGLRSLQGFSGTQGSMSLLFFCRHRSLEESTSYRKEEN